MGTYKASPLEIPHDSENDQHYCGPDVRGRVEAETEEEVVVNGRAMLPVEHVRAEAVVSETFHGVKEGILGEFEVDEVGFREGSVLRGADLVWVMGCRSGEPGSAKAPGFCQRKGQHTISGTWT